MTAPLSGQQLAERCVCGSTPAADRTAAEHEVWCPARKPTADRIAEVKAGTGRPLMDGELEWLRGDAGRAELHISGSRAGAFPVTDDLPSMVVDLAQKLGAVVAELNRTRVALVQSENDLTGANLSLWEEEQETRALREERHSTNEVLSDTAEAIRAKDERVAELEASAAKVAEFVAARAEFITAIRNCHPDNSHDYHRWQGHAESRRQLAETLGLPIAWPAVGGSR